MTLFINLKGKRGEEMPYTNIQTSGDYVIQFLHGGFSFREGGMKLPDEIRIDPTKVNTVEVVTSGPYKFTIEENLSITVSHTAEMSEEQKEFFKQAAEKLSFKEIKFEERDMSCLTVAMDNR